jgi:pyrroloquinoline-quinone synthase
VLLSYLVLFGFVYPGEKEKIPAAVLDALLRRLGEEDRAAASADRVCRGTLLSRLQYLTDLRRFGYGDARPVDPPTWCRGRRPRSGKRPSAARDELVESAGRRRSRPEEAAVTIREALDRDVLARNLLEHPFYRAWSAGTLPAEALTAYARDYGAFVATLPQGWTALADADTAEEEREHARLWDLFARALGTEVGEARTPEVRALWRRPGATSRSRRRRRARCTPSSASSPATAESKLAGLRAFYGLPTEAERYFEEHTHNQHEAEKLAARIEALPPEARARAQAACREMSQALWDALSGLHADCPAA